MGLSPLFKAYVMPKTLQKNCKFFNSKHFWENPIRKISRHILSSFYLLNAILSRNAEKPLSFFSVCVIDFDTLLVESVSDVCKGIPEKTVVSDKIIMQLPRNVNFPFSLAFN